MPETETQSGSFDNGETSTISNGIVSYDTMEDLEASWQGRMEALADEMVSFGWSCVRLDGDSRMIGRRRGNYYAVLGMLDEVRYRMTHDE